MRWYVSRNGETVGPVDEAQVVAWVQAGMTDAVVQHEAGGPWLPVAQSPFAGWIPRAGGAAPPVTKKSSNKAALVILGLLGFGFIVTAAARPHAREAQRKQTQDVRSASKQDWPAPSASAVEATQRAPATEGKRAEDEAGAMAQQLGSPAKTENSRDRATAPLRCCDGTNSSSCTCGGSRRGCCSRHGGVCGCSADQ